MKSVYDMSWRELVDKVVKLESSLDSRTFKPETLVIRHVGEVRLGERILLLVSEVCSVPLETLKSKARSSAVVWPRFIAMALVHRFTHLGPVEIGRLFEKDHGTVINGLSKFRARCGTEAGWRESVETIADRLRISLRLEEVRPWTL